MASIEDVNEALVAYQPSVLTLSGFSMRSESANQQLNLRASPSNIPYSYDLAIKLSRLFSTNARLWHLRYSIN